METLLRKDRWDIGNTYHFVGFASFLFQVILTLKGATAHSYTVLSVSKRNGVKGRQTAAIISTKPVIGVNSE